MPVCASQILVYMRMTPLGRKQTPQIFSPSLVPPNVPVQARAASCSSPATGGSATDFRVRPCRSRGNLNQNLRMAFRDFQQLLRRTGRLATPLLPLL